MPAIPRIARALPHGPIIRPGVSVPVIARLRWANGQDVDVAAMAVAWTREAVEVRWQHQDDLRADWIPARDVRRPSSPPLEDSSRPPTSRGMLKKNRW